MSCTAHFLHLYFIFTSKSSHFIIIYLRKFLPGIARVTTFAIRIAIIVLKITFIYGIELIMHNKKHVSFYFQPYHSIIQPASTVGKFISER